MGRDTGTRIKSLKLPAGGRLPRTVGLLLVRRGRWAVGTARDGEPEARTAAGGTSQSPYARRRGNHGEALVEKVIEAAATRLDDRSLDGLVVGGDRALVDPVLGGAHPPHPVT